MICKSPVPSFHIPGKEELLNTVAILIAFRIKSLFIQSFKTLSFKVALPLNHWNSTANGSTSQSQMPTKVSRIVKYRLYPCCDVSKGIMLLATAAFTLCMCVYLHVNVDTSTCNPLIGILLMLSRKICIYSD
jgi:hypothetical protein